MKLTALFHKRQADVHVRVVHKYLVKLRHRETLFCNTPLKTMCRNKPQFHSGHGKSKRSQAGCAQEGFGPLFFWNVLVVFKVSVLCVTSKHTKILRNYSKNSQASKTNGIYEHTTWHELFVVFIMENETKSHMFWKRKCSAYKYLSSFCFHCY